VGAQSFGPVGMWREKEGVQRSFDGSVYGYAHPARMGSSQEAGGPRSTCGTVGQPGTEGFGAGVKFRVSRLLCRGEKFLDTLYLGINKTFNIMMGADTSSTLARASPADARSSSRDERAGR
jgi:hypothetical protein